MKEKIENEKIRLETLLQVCKNSVKEYEINHPHILTTDEIKNFSPLLERLFNIEIDYLKSNPSEYFELYEEA